MVVATDRSFSLDEYRALEEKSEQRHEYRNREIVAMPGGSLNHSRIGRNLLTYLTFSLRDTEFEPINNDLRLWLPAYQRGLYPDVMVFRGAPTLNENRQDEALDPLTIIEVLSPSTAEYDRENKFRLYRSIPTFTEYLLVEQNEFFVEVYRKQSEGWLLQDYSSLDQVIPIKCLDINLPMTEIYRGISLTA
ncbi:MAG: Uma2 family endonuclease [Limnothrix sp.]